MTGVKEITVFLPAYEEADNLKILLPEINRVMSNMDVSYEVLVIDTVRPMDDTKEVCNAENVWYINRKGGNTYGDAVRTGIEESQGKYIVTMDADGSHEPEEIPKLYREIKTSNADLVIGSRYCEGGCTHNGFLLKSMSFALNLTYRLLFQIKARDISDSYRIYNGERLRNISLKCDNFDIVEEIIIRMDRKYPGFRVKEIPIHFQQRKYGVSKRDLIKFIISYLSTIKRLMSIRRQEKKNG